MEAVIFMGLQAAGKTTFYHQRFARTHVRLSLDELKTRAKERAALLLLLQAQLSFVIDNTNPTPKDRARYVEPALAAGCSIVGYYFEPDIAESLRRNALRSGKARIPVPGLYGTRKRLQPPQVEEGFHSLYSVRLEAAGQFVVTPWPPADEPSALGA